MLHIQMFADLSCPFAYVVHSRWRQIRDEYAGRVQLVHRSLALEYVNAKPNPKRVLDVELPLLMAQERHTPYVPWIARDFEWPVTLWPAFEAVKCAERQGLDQADDLAWTIRTAFFGENRCISMRHVLIDLADTAGLDVETFTTDFDSGRCKQQVLDEARNGWELAKVPGSPTWAFSSGEMHSDFGLPEIDIDKRGRPLILKAAGCDGSACLDYLSTLVESAST